MADSRQRVTRALQAVPSQVVTVSPLAVDSGSLVRLTKAERRGKPLADASVTGCACEAVSKEHHLVCKQPGECPGAYRKQELARPATADPTATIAAVWHHKCRSRAQLRRSKRWERQL